VVELLAHPNVKAKITDEEHGTSYSEVRNAVRLRRLRACASRGEVEQGRHEP
jgi:hypothetical protein